MDARPDEEREADPHGAGPVSHAIYRLARLHRQLAGQLLRRAGLRPGQEQLMMHLWETGRQRQTDLIAVLGSDSATMTRAVQRLEKAGFVRRTPCVTDRRVVMVEPTPAGLALRERVEELWRVLEELTTRDYDREQAATALRVLEGLERNVTRALAPTAPPDRTARTA